MLFAAGSSYIQLLGALGPDTPVGRSLASRGPGVHHVAYRVDDIDAALAHMRTEGARLIDEAPRPGSRDTAIAFVHPRRWAASWSSSSRSVDRDATALDDAQRVREAGRQPLLAGR